MPDVGIDPWARAKRDAVTLAPGRLGSLLWIDNRCQAYGMFGLDTWWVGAFKAFYDSGKMVMVCRKGLRAGGSASACRGLVRVALFTERDLDQGTVGVIPIMSATRDEANDRFVTIMAILRACGIGPEKNSEDPDLQAASGGVCSTYKSTKSQAGGGIIRTKDSQGHTIEFRILPVLIRHAIGYTGVAGFLDESDKWPDDPERCRNPATEIFDTIGERFTTQTPDEEAKRKGITGAELFIFSASYEANSAHKKLIDEGVCTSCKAEGRVGVCKQCGGTIPNDTPLQHISRLGADGARIDEEARMHLAASESIDDPKLTAPSDPMSPNIPAWVSNRTKSPIATCYLWSKQRIGRMLGRYGGRAAENADEQAHPDALSTVVFPIDECASRMFRDRVIGVSMGPELWGIVALAVHADGFTVTDDVSGRYASADACAGILRNAVAIRASSVLVPSRQLDALRSELRAHASGNAQPMVCTGEVAAEFRTGPLRTLYQSGRLAHAPGLDALEADARAWTQDGPRMPRLEALAAAVAHLVACYPWMGVPAQEPMRGPVAVEPMTAGPARGAAVLRRLGAYVGPGEGG